MLRPARGIVVCHALRWHQELRDVGDLASLVPTMDRELELAEMLISEMTGVDIFFALRRSHETL
ncbi:hypothetical protein AOB60_02515 [Streptomyces noursei]|uniref:Uncharacterized protein n=1 Tax=Streptomyces noursei TaxID=1971 RepID=A0A2N8PFZ8_STRNR|nr:hypothetical protein AOB60_02515 [Streptomyces noursei]